MSAEVIQFDESWARRITERIRYSAIGVHDGIEKLRTLMDEAQRGDAHTLLGYPSWTAYIADVMGEEPLRLARDERRDLVAWLSGQGMSTRAIAPIVGVDNATVYRDLGRVANATPEPPAHRRTYSDEENGFYEVVMEHEDMLVNTKTGEVIEEAPAPVITEHTVTEKTKTVTGLDGKEYKRPEPKTPRRKSIIDDAMKARHDLWAAVTKIQTIMQDDRYNANKAGIQDALHPAARLANEVFANLFDTKESEEI